jgi:hypothetical protein
MYSLLILVTTGTTLTTFGTLATGTCGTLLVTLGLLEKHTV